MSDAATTIELSAKDLTFEIRDFNADGLTKAINKLLEIVTKVIE